MLTLRIDDVYDILVVECEGQLVGGEADSELREKVISHQRVRAVVLDLSSVYAIGDVVPTPLLAHLASKEGIVAVEHLAGKKDVRPINLRLVPNCTYCDPEVASVGLTEAKAKEQGYDVKVGRFPFSASGKARILGEEEGFVKIVSEKKYDEILGVHIIGPHATELIAEACVAMQLESTADELGRTMHAHPTVSEAVMEAAEGVHDLAVHI